MSSFVPNLITKVFYRQKTSDEVITLPLSFDCTRPGFLPTRSLVYSSSASKVTDQILVPIAGPGFKARITGPSTTNLPPGVFSSPLSLGITAWKQISPPRFGQRYLKSIR